ncbi:MAG: helix-turn-helix transcriptional regulator [Sedimenticola sp.]
MKDNIMAKVTRTYSNRTLQAIKIFASQIRIARKKHHWSVAELAERVGTTRPTIQQIEQGNPATGLGLYFEAANILGILLFEANEHQMTVIQKNLDMSLSLLPKRIDKDRSEVFDDF